MNADLKMAIVKQATSEENNDLKTQIANMRVQLEDMKLKYVQALQRENSLMNEIREIKKKEINSLLEGRFLVPNKTIA